MSASRFVCFAWLLLYVASTVTCSEQENTTAKIPADKIVCHTSCQSCLSNSRFGCSACRDGDYLSSIYECLPKEPMTVQSAVLLLRSPTPEVKKAPKPLRFSKWHRNTNTINDRSLKRSKSRTKPGKPLLSAFYGLFTNKRRPNEHRSADARTGSAGVAVWIKVRPVFGSGHTAKLPGDLRFTGIGGFRLFDQEEVEYGILDLRIEKDRSLVVGVRTSQVKRLLFDRSDLPLKLWLQWENSVVFRGYPSDSADKSMHDTGSKKLEIQVSSDSKTRAAIARLRYDPLEFWNPNIPWNFVINLFCCILLAYNNVVGFLLVKIVQEFAIHTYVLPDSGSVLSFSAPQSLLSAAAHSSRLFWHFYIRWNFGTADRYSAIDTASVRLVRMCEGLSVVLLFRLCWLLFPRNRAVGYRVAAGEHLKQVRTRFFSFSDVALANTVLVVKYSVLQPLFYEYLCHTLFALLQTPSSESREQAKSVLGWWWFIKTPDNLCVFLIALLDSQKSITLLVKYRTPSSFFASEHHSDREVVQFDQVETEGWLPVDVEKDNHENQEIGACIFPTVIISLDLLLQGLRAWLNIRARFFVLALMFIFDFLHLMFNWESQSAAPKPRRLLLNTQKGLYATVWVVLFVKVCDEEGTHGLFVVSAFFGAAAIFWINRFMMVSDYESARLNDPSPRLAEDLVLRGLEMLRTQPLDANKSQNEFLRQMFTPQTVKRQPVTRAGRLCGHYSGDLVFGVPCGQGYYVDLPFVDSHPKDNTHTEDEHRPTEFRREYKGQFAGGRPHGQGRLRILGPGHNRQPTEVYRGSFVNGNFEGYGRLRMVSVDRGEQYSAGMFRDGRRDGPHLIEYRDGGVEFAQFRLGKRHGESGGVSPTKKHAFYTEYEDGEEMEDTRVDFHLKKLRYWTNSSLLSD